MSTVDYDVIIVEGPGRMTAGSRARLKSLLLEKMIMQNDDNHPWLKTARIPELVDQN